MYALKKGAISDEPTTKSKTVTEPAFGVQIPGANKLIGDNLNQVEINDEPKTKVRKL